MKPIAIAGYGMSKKTTRLPFLVWVVFVATGFAIIGGTDIAGFRMSGLSWFFPLSLALLVFVARLHRVSFPVWIWIPWVLVLFFYLVADFPYSLERPVLQRTAQILCPLVVGLAVSTYRVDEETLGKFVTLCKRIVIVLVFVSLLKTGFILTGQIPETTGLAAEIMVALLFCGLFAANYANGEKRELYWWIACVALAVYAMRRTPIAVALLTLPLTFGEMRYRKRIWLLGAILVVGLMIFYTPRVQQRMFYSGAGSITDVMSGRIDDSGRFYMWEALKYRIEAKPWFGNGTNSASTFVYNLTGGIEQPHNDWLATLHDHGVFGTVMLLLCMVFATVHAWYRAKESVGKRRLLFLTGASSFVTLALMMLTDNILIYAAYFGNLQFTVLGLAYSAYYNPKKEPVTLGCHGV